MSTNLSSETENTLFNAIFVPNLSESIKKGLQKSNAEIVNMTGRKSYVSIGKPECNNLRDIFISKNQAVPGVFEELSSKYDFYQLVFSCSFLPDKNCSFVWARFGVELKAYFGGKRLAEEPIVYDMYPDEVLNEITYKKEVNFDNNLKIQMGVLNNEDTIKISDLKEYIRYEPEITAFGYRTSSVAWNFKSTSSKDICGNKRNLIIVVQTPKHSNIKGKFLVGAEIKTNNIFVPLKRIDDLIDVEYLF